MVFWAKEQDWYLESMVLSHDIEQRHDLPLHSDEPWPQEKSVGSTPMTWFNCNML